MSGSEIVQIVSLFLTAAVSITTVLVRARIIALEGEIKGLNEIITTANTLILKQGNTIDQMSAQIIAMADTPSRGIKREPRDTDIPY